MRLDTTISGIPCQIKVTHYSPGQEPRYSGAWEDDDPPDSPEIEFDVLDRRGRPAPWLAKKMTTKDEERICLEIENEH